MSKLDRKENNLDILRLVAAWMVLFSHSFILYDGISNDFMVEHLKYESLSHIALNIFFIISGYLITQSFLYRKNIKLFAASRLLRIVPGLAVVLLLTTFVLGPIITQIPLEEYFSNKNTYKYLRGVLVFPLKYELPGVFETLPYANTVNGSLWSLEVELKCYLMIGLLGLCTLLRSKMVYLMTISCVLLYAILGHFADSFDKYILIFKYSNLYNGSIWFSAFLLGAAFYYLRDKIKYNFKIFILVLIADLLIWYFIPFGKYLHLFTMAYMVIYFGLHTKPIGRVLKGNDISYGVYIYAFPIQQTYMLYVGDKLGFSAFVIITTLITVVFGILSWKIVEKPSLALKKKFKDHSGKGINSDSSGTLSKV